jgi:nucleoside phosphorylase
VGQLSLKPYAQKPFELWGKGHIRLLISGIGKANAAMGCAWLILKHHPACILNLGAAGATDCSSPLGTVYHVSKIIEPDRPRLGSDMHHEHISNILEGFPMATLATNDRAIKTPEERARMALIAQLTDMEGASVVQTCQRFMTPSYVFKFVSDTPDDHKIRENIVQYREASGIFLGESVFPLLEFK